MKLLQETTKWPGTTPNHIYALSEDKSKLYAYIPAGTTEVRNLKTFIRFDSRGRTFKVVKNTFGIDLTADVVKNAERWEVKGSKGDVYVVERDEGVLKCSCSGFKFRGQCRHIKEIK